MALRDGCGCEFSAESPIAVRGTTKLQVSKKQARQMGWLAAAFLWGGSLVMGQATQQRQETPSTEDLNYIGAEAVMPPFAESVVDPNSAFRSGMARKGMALRLIEQLQYAQNTLAGPVPADQQGYAGQHPFEGAMSHLIFTSDLRQLGLKHAQFYASGVWNWVSWRPAGPKTLQIWDVDLYKDFGDGLVQVKAGYLSNNLEFVGLTVGGSTASAAQGVYAVLPYEVGLSYFPLATPGINIRVRGPKSTYFKNALQRSVDPAGGPAEVARNATGFRFAPKGDKLLEVAEVGWQHTASTTQREMWLRIGYLRNASPYINLNNGKKEGGNENAFVLFDYQARQPDAGQPQHGLYAGVTAMTAAARFNGYDRYYEARLYQKAPFRKRPADMASLVASYTGHSRYLTDALVADGKTVWRNGATVTGSYSVRVRAGHYMGLGLSYLHGPTITPRTDDALTFATTYTVFF